MSESAAGSTALAVPGIYRASAPVDAADRISALDLARGVALLGILLMNIIAFALPHQAYNDPTVAGGETGLNLGFWAVNFVMFEGKMRALFSMLFGAGVVLLTSREQQMGRGAMADVYYRRLLWLVLFGVLHAYVLLWPGDILYPYAVCGLFLYAVRNVAPRPLILAGLVLLAVLFPRTLLESRAIEATRSAALAADSAAAAGATLSEEQQAAQREWKEKLEELKPGPEAQAKTIEMMRSGYPTIFMGLAPINSHLQSAGLYRFGFWDIAGMMLLGMGLFKLGVLTAARSMRFYAAIAVLGYGIGIPLGIYVARAQVASGFAIDGSLWLSWYTYDLRRLSMVLAHVALIMMVCKSGALAWLTSRLAAVGRTAFSNYILQTLICTLLFYGYGLALYGSLERIELLYVVLAVWGLQLLVTPIWLRHFRFGPLEWGWRSLTYWQRQPMRLGAVPVAAPLATVPVGSTGGEGAVGRAPVATDEAQR